MNDNANPGSLVDQYLELRIVADRLREENRTLQEKADQMQRVVWALQETVPANTFWNAVRQADQR